MFNNWTSRLYHSKNLTGIVVLIWAILTVIALIGTLSQKGRSKPDEYYNQSYYENADYPAGVPF